MNIFKPRGGAPLSLWRVLSILVILLLALPTVLSIVQIAIADVELFPIGKEPSKKLGGRILSPRTKVTSTKTYIGTVRRISKELSKIDPKLLNKKYLETYFKKYKELVRYLGISEDRNVIELLIKVSDIDKAIMKINNIVTRVKGKITKILKHLKVIKVELPFVNSVIYRRILLGLAKINYVESIWLNDIYNLELFDTHIILGVDRVFKDLKYNVKIADAPGNITKQMAELGIYMEMMSKGFPVEPKTVVKKLDLSADDKKRWIEFIEQGQRQQQEAQQLQAQAQQQEAGAKIQADIQKTQIKSEADLQKAQINSQTKLIEIQNKRQDEDADRALAEKESIRDFICLLYTSPSPRDLSTSRMPSSA